MSPDYEYTAAGAVLEAARRVGVLSSLTGPDIDTLTEQVQSFWTSHVALSRPTRNDDETRGFQAVLGHAERLVGQWKPAAVAHRPRPSDPVSEYELQRRDNVSKNRAMLQSLGL